MNTKKVDPEVYNCGKCDKKITDWEACAYCPNPLCSNCWERWGHCGHQVMYEKNSIAQVSRIKDLEAENAGLKASNEASKGVVSMLEAENKSFWTR